MNIVQFRRKRESKTDYKKRIKLLLGNKARAVIRKSLNHISIQLIKYNPKGDIIIISAHSRELKELGWEANTSNIPAAYLTGLLMAREIAREIEERVQYPGEIKVHVIRESRAVEFAK